MLKERTCPTLGISRSPSASGDISRSLYLPSGGSSALIAMTDLTRPAMSATAKSQAKRMTHGKLRLVGCTAAAPEVPSKRMVGRW